MMHMPSVSAGLFGLNGVPADADFRGRGMFLWKILESIT